MPYIRKNDREFLDKLVTHFTAYYSVDNNFKEVTVTPGELNYFITRILMKSMGPISYTKANAMIGVLECVKLELYRRSLASYEDQKILDNGDVKEYQDDTS